MTDTKHAVQNAMRWLGRIGQHLAAGFWPRVCVLCHRDLEKNEDILCLHCLASLPLVRRSNPDLQIVYLGAPGGHIRVLSWFVYNHEHPSHTLIHNIKYHDRRFTAEKLGREFGRTVIAHGDLDSHPIDLILPIPLHWGKYIKRGYNQADEIARGFAEITGCKVGNNIYARRAHKTQTQRAQIDRAENVKDIFAIHHPDQLNNRHIAILDDVITTGATVIAAVKAILDVSHPASITAISLANTRLD